ncbi:hypothetical protein D3C80_1611320 [compost metagenome]
MHRQFGLFLLCIADRWAVRFGMVQRAAIEDGPVNAALVQTLIQLAFCLTLGEKFQMTDLDSVGVLRR